MANVGGQFYSGSKGRSGTTPESPSTIVGETAYPLNPPGSGGGDIPPVSLRYASDTAMFADQVNQKSGFLYFDGTDTYWYLGTTNGNITDYEVFGSGGGGLPSGGGTGQVLTKLSATDGDADWQDIPAVDGGDEPTVKTTSSADQSLPSGILTILDFDVTLNNNAPAKYTVATNGRITVNDTGIFDVTAGVVVEANLLAALESASLGIFRNGDLVAVSSVDTTIAAGNSAGLNCSTQLALSDGDIIDARVLVNSVGGVLPALFRFLSFLLGSDATQVNSLTIVKCVSSGGVESVTGTGVDNTDPANPVISQSPYNLAQEGATDGEVLTWVAANSRYEPVAPSGGGGADANAVHYNVADGKSVSEKAQARANIGSTSMDVQFISTNGTVNNLVKTSNTLIFNGTATSVLTGISDPTNGEEVVIFNLTPLNLVCGGSTSSTSRRFDPSVTIPSGEVVRFKYYNSRWRPAVYRGYVDKFLPDTKTGDLTLVNSLLLPTGGIQAISSATSANNGGSFRFGEAGLEAFRIGRDNITGGGFGTSQFIRKCYFYDSVDFRTGGSLSGTNTAQVNTATGRVFHARSGAANESIRRDEQNLFYLVSITTAGSINDQTLTDGIFNYRFTAATSISGFTLGEIGKTIDIDNATGATLTLGNENVGSIAANRIKIIGAADLVIPIDGKVRLKYCTGSRWELLSKNF